MTQNTVLDNSFETEALAAQHTALRGRIVALCLIAVLITLLTPWPGPVYIYLLLLVFALLGWGSYRIATAPWGRTWHQYAFVSADFALLAFTLIYPNPLVPTDLPPQFSMRYGNFVYFFVLLSGLAYIYRPRLVVWGGLSVAVAWLIGIAWLFSLPGTVWREPQDRDVEAYLQLFASPTFIDLGVRVQEVVVLLICAGLLALAVKRARTIALRQADLARERANLARYFPRNTADMLAGKAAGLSRPREQNAAVLFADLVAFTGWAEQRRPEEVIRLLRDVHGRLTDIVFRHEGTLDKFIGDGLMATFGAHEQTGRDATNALAAAIEIDKTFEDWRRARPVSDDQLALAIGVHYGPVVIGDIGTSHRREFAVLGDTVNVASRLEQATRAVGCRCLISRDLVDAATAENPPKPRQYRHRLREHAPIALRGRSTDTAVFMLD